MLPKKILQQKQMMAKAIQLLNDIETLERLIKPVDPITYKVMAAQLQEKYAETMYSLMDRTGILSLFEND